jgi:hypothetical protein
MNGLTFPTLAQAQAVQAQVDAALGYPKAGVDIGSGAHAPPSQSITTTYMQPVPLATIGYGYPVDATVTAVLMAPQAAAIGPIAPQAVAQPPSTATVL